MHYEDVRICIRKATDDDGAAIIEATGRDISLLRGALVCLSEHVLVALSAYDSNGRRVTWVSPDASRVTASLLRTMAL